MVEVKNFSQVCDTVRSRPTYQYAAVYESTPRKSHGFGELRISEQVVLCATGKQVLTQEDEIFSDILKGPDSPGHKTTVHFVPNEQVDAAKTAINAFVQSWISGSAGVDYVDEGQFYIALAYTQGGVWVLTLDNTTPYDAFYAAASKMFDGVLEFTDNMDGTQAVKLGNENSFSGVHFFNHCQSHPIAELMQAEKLWANGFEVKFAAIKEQIATIAGNVFDEAKSRFASIDFQAKGQTLKETVEDGIKKVKEAIKKD